MHQRILWDSAKMEHQLFSTLLSFRCLRNTLRTVHKFLAIIFLSSYKHFQIEPRWWYTNLLFICILHMGLKSCCVELGVCCHEWTLGLLIKNITLIYLHFGLMPNTSVSCLLKNRDRTVRNQKLDSHKDNREGLSSYLEASVYLIAKKTMYLLLFIERYNTVRWILRS